MGMILRELLPLHAAIWAEAEAILITERVDGKSQDNRIEHWHLKVHLLSDDIEDLLFIEVFEIFLLLTGFLTLIVGRFVAVELLDFRSMTCSTGSRQRMHSPSATA